MRDWHAFVRARVKLPGLRPERETRIVKELASQLEDFYREALACGATADQADAHACRQVRDWERMTQDSLARRSPERAAATRAAGGSTRWNSPHEKELVRHVCRRSP
jgi:hypothetical protein